MKELTQIYKDTGKQLIEDLFKDYLVVTEKLSGSSFSFKKSGEGINFYKGKNHRPINLIDRTMMVYYEKPIHYIKSIVTKNLSSIPDNWMFCFQYFPHNSPGIITYDRLPKNNLVLSHISVTSPSGKVLKVIEDPRVLNDWANALGVTALLPIFKGYLTEDQKKKITKFLDTPKEDQSAIFNTNSFAEYLLKILNPSIQSTTLQNDLKKPIESIIFKFYKSGTKQVIAAKLIDPYTINLMKEKEPIDLRKMPADINEIILLDLLAFIEERGIKKHEILGDTEDMRYIELVSNIFNDYVTKRGKDITKIDIEKAEFAKGDEFDLNVELIPSQRTKDILNSNPKLKDLFKIILGSLKKKRKNTGNIMTPSVIEDFNKMVDKVIDVIQTKDDGKFKTFDDYLKIKSTNESLLPNAEELLIEDKVLDYNNFINLGKVIVEDNRKSGEIWKTSTGFRGQDANGDRKTFKSKEQTQSWIKTGREDVDKEPTEKTKEEKTSEEIEALNKATEGIKGHTGDKISEKSVEKSIKGNVEKIKAKLKNLDPEQQKHAQDLIDGMEAFSDAKTPKEKEEAIKNLVDKGLIKRNEPGTSTVKIYIDPKTGLDYKEFGQNTALHQSITAYDQKARNDGEELIPTQRKSTMGGKKMNPSGIFKDKNGKPMVDAVDIKRVEGGVNIGGVDYEKNPDPEKDPEFNKKLISHFTKDGKFDKEAYDSAVTAIQRNNEIIDEVEKVLVEGGRLDVVDPLPGTQPTTPENAKKVGNAAINQTANKIEQELKAAGNDPLTKDQKEIVDRMKNLEKLDGEEFEKELLEVAALVAANPATDAGFADMCETFSYISALKEGRAAYLPTAGNFPLGDLVSMSNAKISNEDFDDPDAMSNKIKLMQISVENRSIKAKGGAASSSSKKNELTTFKEATNKKTGKPIPGGEVKQDMQDINDKAYFAVWDSDDPEDIKKEQTKLNGLAEKYGVDTTSDSYKKDKEDSVKTALAKVAKDRAKDSKKYPPLSKKEEALLRAKLEAYYDMGKIYEKGYNDNYDTQLYTNENWDYDKKAGKVTRSQTDGICEVSDVKFAFNVGFGKSGRPANRVPTRFHNVNKCKEDI